MPREFRAHRSHRKWTKPQSQTRVRRLAAPQATSAPSGATAVADKQDVVGEGGDTWTRGKRSARSRAWVWGQGKPETLHPFWAVRRLTAQQLDGEITTVLKRNKTAVAAKEDPVPRFNCEFVEYTQTLVNVSAMGDVTQNCTRNIKIPMMTNSEALTPGDELILKNDVMAKQKQEQKRTWRDVARATQQTSKAKRGKT